MSEEAKIGDINIAPKTTAEQDLTTAGQRNVNLMWKTTQRWIAISVTTASLIVAIFLSIVEKEVSVKLAAIVFLYGASNLVIGFYFGRTSHQKTGGVSTGDNGR